jgi:hypothetical protein
MPKKKKKKSNDSLRTISFNDPLESINSPPDNCSESSSTFSNLSEELLFITDKYRELMKTTESRIQLESNLLRGSSDFMVQFVKDINEELNRVFLYEGSLISVTDLCILLNALRSRYLYIFT